MKISTSAVPEVIVIAPDVYGDERGYFLETWHSARYAEVGIDRKFVQDNRSRSQRGVLRGLHYQLNQPQGKLVSVSRGRVFDVAVDIRLGSPWFGHWVGEELSDSNHKQLYVPPGFAHGFCVLSDSADFTYKCTDYYAPEDEYGILWNDPDIGIQWPGSDFQVSQKDTRNKLLHQMGDLLPVYKSPR
ncbi:MAG: dTDP-4-dehydrorhamnose 3,5-epimerase [Gammaproteobacteria bacterium]|nr:dTDP-4-dehydrorhamnose 3,5-epimerase [Gammaproteobacteria bacterium]